MKSSELNQRRQQATPRGVGVMCNYFVEKAENATLWDIEGNEVIDFAAGIAVLNTGHRHPKVVAAVADHDEVRDVRRVEVLSDKTIAMRMLFDPGHSLEERILREQFGY